MAAPQMNLNAEKDGIELSFPDKPNQEVLTLLRENEFRWHRENNYWYARQTDTRLAVAKQICGLQEKELQAKSKKDPRSKQQANPTGQKNTFANSYERIGDVPIRQTGDFDFLELTHAYIQDLNLLYKRDYSASSMVLTDLIFAGRSGKACDQWRIYPNLDDYGESVTCILHNEDGIKTPAELLDALRNEKALHCAVTHQTEKGIDVFSPFVEYKPLEKVPEKWTKANFTKALLSGQIFEGEITDRYTDDYMYDAATNYSSGIRIDMSAAAAHMLDDWSTLSYVSAGPPTQNGQIPLSYSHCNTYKSFTFDINCDIAQAKRRGEARDASILRYNEMLKKSCIQLDPDKIDPGKIYSVQILDTNTNSGIYGIKDETLQGFRLKERVQDYSGLYDFVGATEFVLQPDKLYTVSNFYDRMTQNDDDRLIFMGNYKNICTGKALSEITAEGKYVPHISVGEENGSFEYAQKELQKLAAGQRRYMFSSNGDYAASLVRLEKEYSRASAESLRPPLTDLIAEAESKHSNELRATDSPIRDR